MLVFASGGPTKMKAGTMNTRRDARNRSGDSAIAPVEMPGLDNHLCFALYAASNHMTRLFVPFLKKLGVTYPQYLVLVVLWERGAQGGGELAAIRKICIESALERARFSPFPPSRMIQIGRAFAPFLPLRAGRSQSRGDCLERRIGLSFPRLQQAETNVSQRSLLLSDCLVAPLAEGH